MPLGFAAEMYATPQVLIPGLAEMLANKFFFDLFRDTNEAAEHLAKMFTSRIDFANGKHSPEATGRTIRAHREAKLFDSPTLLQYSLGAMDIRAAAAYSLQRGEEGLSQNEEDSLLDGPGGLRAFGKLHQFPDDLLCADFGGHQLRHIGLVDDLSRTGVMHPMGGQLFWHMLENDQLKSTLGNPDWEEILTLITVCDSAVAMAVTEVA